MRRHFFINLWLLLALFSVVWSPALWAVSCDAIFPYAIQNTNNAGSITFNNQARVINSPNNTVATINLIDNAGANNSCNGVSCTADANLVPMINVNTFPNGADVNVGFWGSKTITPGAYNKITVGSSGTLKLLAGDYTLKKTLTVETFGNLVVQGGGTVRIYVKEGVTFKLASSINAGQSASQLFVYSKKAVDIDSWFLFFNTEVNAFLYGQEGVTLGFDARVTGAVAAKKDITLNDFSSITYDASALASGDFGDFCDSGAAGPDHYSISHDGTGVTCQSEHITITAHDASHSPVDAGSAVVNLSTSTTNGDWISIVSGAGNLVNGTTNDGAAIYTFPGTGSTNAVLEFTHRVVGTVNFNASDGAVTETSGDADGTDDANLVFSDSGFIFLNETDVSNTIITQTAGKDSDDAPNAKNYVLQAVRSSDDDASVCTSAFASGTTVNVEMGGECQNPTSCADVQLSVSNNSVTTSLATNDNNGGGGTSGYTTTPLLFGADAKAPLVFNYPDVGLMQLHARYNLLLDGGGGSGNFMLGSSNDFIVKPANFVITTIESSDADTNPASTSGGLGFVAAGEGFRVVVEARNTQDNRTPNYGNETVAEGIAFNFSTLTFPSGIGSSNGSFGNASSFSTTGTAGQFENTTINWSEVGTFTAFASVADGDYLGAGDISGTVTDDIGRFYPDHFTLSSHAVTNSCPTGIYTYLSELAVGVGFTVTAESEGGATTTNYDNATLNYLVTSVNLVAENNNDGTDLSGRLTVVSNTWGDGVYTLADTTASLNRLSIVEEAPLANVLLGLTTADIDGVDFNALDMKADASNDCVTDGDCTAKQLNGSLNALFGRLYLQSVHGPETAALAVPFQSEYWNGSQFIKNSSDNCTKISTADIQFDGEAIDIDINREVTVSSSTSTGNFGPGNVNVDSAVDILSLMAGDGELVFSAPGATNIGSFPVQVDLSAYTWLQYDWDRDGVDNNTVVPDITVSFGSYRGHDRIIFWRERLTD